MIVYYHALIKEITPLTLFNKDVYRCECKNVYNKEMDVIVKNLHFFLFHEPLKQCQDC